VLVTIEKAADGKLRELARAIDISQNERVGKIGVGLCIDWQGRFSIKLRSCIKVREDVVTIVRLVLRFVSCVM
jgi:hypothetical protein